MKKIFSVVTILVAFFSFMPAVFSQGGGGSTPDTALNNAVFFVHVSKRPNPNARETNENATANLETYMAIITAPENNATNKDSHITFYKISCSTCNVLKWTPPAKEVPTNPSLPLRYASNKVVSTVSGAAEPVTDPELKKQLLKALMVQTASARRLLQMEIGQ